MENRILLLLFISMIPVFTALTGTVIEAVSLQDSVTVREKHVKQMLMYYFIVFIVIGSGVSTGLALPVVSVWLWPLTVFSLYMAPVLYYRFVVILTDTGNKDHTRSGIRYLLSALVAAGCFLLCFFVPSDVRLQLLKGKNIHSLPLTAFLFYTIPAVQFILTTICMALAYRKLSACYRENRTKNPLWKKWFRLSLSLCVLSLVWSGTFFFISWRRTVLWTLPLAVAAAWGQAVFLCSHSFNRRSLLFLPLALASVPLKTPFAERLSAAKSTWRNYRAGRRRTPAGGPVEVKPYPLTRKMFERQVAGKKLFLNPRLRLSDLTELFRTNRTYLSGFINREYGYGFNGYINRLRLAELERLMSLPDNRNQPANKLYSTAGFPNYQVYLRIKREVRGRSNHPVHTDLANTAL